MILDNKDAIYITSWAAYNEGRAAGGWFNLADLTSMVPEERIEAYKAKGLDPYGRDEELVVHDYDDYTGIGYYELFGEPHPGTVIEFYEKLEGLIENELLVFIGLRETQSTEIAMDALENETLDNWTVYSYDLMVDLAEQQLEQEISTGALGYVADYIDRDYIRRDLEMDISYDEEDIPEYEVEEEDIDMFIQNTPMDTLRPYIDIEGYMRYIATDYSDFEHDGEIFYLVEY